MSLLALICAAVGLALVAYASWRAHRAEQQRRRNNGNGFDIGHGLELELDDEHRVRVHDERVAANSIYNPDGRKVKAVRHVPPRPPAGS